MKREKSAHKVFFQFTDRLRSALGDRTRGYCPHLITYVESAEGLMNMKDVLKRAQTFSMEGVYHLDGVVFGSDDFCADIGICFSPALFPVIC